MKIRSMSVTAGCVAGVLLAATPAAATTNLIRNPGFESGLAFWATASSTTLSRVTTAYSGHYAAQVVNPRTQRQNCYITDHSNTVARAARGRYRGGLWVRSTHTGQHLIFTVREHTPAHRLVGESHRSVTLTTSWRHVVVTYRTHQKGNVVGMTALAPRAPRGVCLLADDASLEFLG